MILIRGGTPTEVDANLELRELDDAVFVGSFCKVMARSILDVLGVGWLAGSVTPS